jgi:TolA-binding protein
MMLLALSGCATLRKAPPPKPAARPQAKPVDAKAQQHYYDLGLQQYSKENYGKAKEAFQQAVEFGPNTALGLKAQENLKKIQQILKTLEELESK